jgi:hypothetical protein
MASVLFLSTLGFVCQYVYDLSPYQALFHTCVIYMKPKVDGNFLTNAILLYHTQHKHYLNKTSTRFTK